MKTTEKPVNIHRYDDEWMRLALTLGRRGQGCTAPNPAVGCIIVKDGVLLGRGWTCAGGRPHAETIALAQAGASTQGATAYVSLEPCAHHGVTPPCTDALIKAGIACVVVAAPDPDPRVNGKGITKLRQAGVEVRENILAAQAAYDHRGFFYAKSKNRPQFTLKLAVSCDGKIAHANGDSKWITGPVARQYGHLMRARHDAILVGVNTVLADDPMLDCRVSGMEHRSPIRIILDTQLRTPLDAKIVRTADAIETIIITENDANHAEYQNSGVHVVSVVSTKDVAAIAAAIVDLEITSVLIEGGAQVAASFLAEGFVDDCAVFSAPHAIGHDGLNAIAKQADIQLALTNANLTKHHVRMLGPDMLATYRKAE